MCISSPSDTASPSSASPLLSQTSKSPAVTSPKSSNIFIVKAITGFLWVVFGFLDIALSVLSLFCDQKQEPGRTSGVKTVVIVGGNFAGLAALRELQKWKKTHSGDVRIILIDQRTYSEYTPGILRLFCDPAYFFQLVQALPDGHDLERIQGIVTSIVAKNPVGGTDGQSIDTLAKVLTYVPTSNGEVAKQKKNIRYDYLILATGATYNQPISAATSTATTLLGRYEEWKRTHERLKASKRVLILGGGPVGVELAAEILDHDSNNTQVTIVDAQTRLVPLFPKSVGDYAEKWLTRRGARLCLGEPLQSWTESSCTMKDGRILHADIVCVCFGSRPNSKMIENEDFNHKSNGLFSLTSRQNIVVKDTLQLVIGEESGEGKCSAAPWFACGDVASPPSNDEKQAFQAEVQGKLSARNVIKLLEKSHPKSSNNNEPNLLRYPTDIADQIPLVFVLSLGRYDGVLGFNSFTVPGSLAAIVKWILEYTKVSQMRGHLFGNLIWKTGDALTLFLSRTLFKSSSEAKP